MTNKQNKTKQLKNQSNKRTTSLNGGEWITVNWPRFGMTSKLYERFGKPNHARGERLNEEEFSVWFPTSIDGSKVMPNTAAKKWTHGARFQLSNVTVLMGRYVLLKKDGDRWIFKRTERVYRVKDSV